MVPIGDVVVKYNSDFAPYRDTVEKSGVNKRKAKISKISQKSVVAYLTYGCRSSANVKPELINF